MTETELFKRNKQEPASLFKALRNPDRGAILEYLTKTRDFISMLKN